MDNIIDWFFSRVVCYAIYTRKINMEPGSMGPLEIRKSSKPNHHETRFYLLIFWGIAQILSDFYDISTLGQNILNLKILDWAPKKGFHLHLRNGTQFLSWSNIKGWEFQYLQEQLTNPNAATQLHHGLGWWKGGNTFLFFEWWFPIPESIGILTAFLVWSCLYLCIYL